MDNAKQIEKLNKAADHGIISREEADAAIAKLTAK
jgi:hypothetical protein